MVNVTGSVKGLVVGFSYRPENKNEKNGRTYAEEHRVHIVSPAYHADQEPVLAAVQVPKDEWQRLQREVPLWAAVTVECEIRVFNGGYTIYKSREAVVVIKDDGAAKSASNAA